MKNEQEQPVHDYTMRYFITAGVLLLCITITIPGSADEAEDLFHQAGIYSILEKGGFDPVVTVEGMATRGDLGIGGFVHMNGELIQFNSTIYQITSDGEVSVPSEEEEITYMNTVEFNPEWDVHLTGPMNLSEMKEEIARTFPGDDHIYAIRIDGNFSGLSARSLTGQQKPYPPLANLIANQSIFNRTKTSGSIIGFWFPEWMKGVNVAGFHLHILTEDRKTGGHLLGCELQEGTAMIDPVQSFRVDRTLITNTPFQD